MDTVGLLFATRSHVNSSLTVLNTEEAVETSKTYYLERSFYHENPTCNQYGRGSFLVLVLFARLTKAGPTGRGEERESVGKGSLHWTNLVTLSKQAEDAGGSNQTRLPEEIPAA
jgi:hypothetical protein